MNYGERKLRNAALAFCCVIGANATTAAQAWVPARGEGEFSVVYQNAYTADHLSPEGQPINAGKIRLLGMIQSMDLGLSDKLALSASLPLFTAKYDGANPHLYVGEAPHLSVDNGTYHGGVQDFRFAVRYNFVEKPLLLTPYIGFSHPTAHYEHYAHSAIGADMWELGLGFHMGRRLDPILPNAYFQTRYTYIVTEKIHAGSLAIRPNRSRVDTELGYFVTRRFSVRALMNTQVTHGGLDQNLKDFPVRTSSDPLWLHHDQISTINYINLGGGASMSVTKSLDVFASMARTAWGTNGHKLNMGLTVGMSWSFRMPWANAPVMYMQEASNWRAKPNEIKLCH